MRLSLQGPQGLSPSGEQVLHHLPCRQPFLDVPRMRRCVCRGPVRIPGHTRTPNTRNCPPWSCKLGCPSCLWSDSILQGGAWALSPPHLLPQRPAGSQGAGVQSDHSATLFLGCRVTSNHWKSPGNKGVGGGSQCHVWVHTTPHSCAESWGPRAGSCDPVHRGNQGGGERAQSPCGEQGDTGVSSDPQALPSLLAVQEPGRQLSSQRWGWGVALPILGGGSG